MSETDGRPTAPLPGEDAAHVPLRDYVEARIVATEKASDLHKEELDRLREQLRIQQVEGIPRREHDMLSERIGRVEQKQANLDGRLWVVAIGIPLAVTVVSLLIDKFIH